MMLRLLIVFLSLFLSLFAGDTVQDLKLTSEHMKEHNPLLPKLEPELWRQLLSAEKEFKNSAGNSQKKEAFLELATRLTNIHRLERSENKIVLGGITWDRRMNTLSIPAKLRYPNPGMPLEVLLCRQNGRVHETLFLTETRPLHLEVLLHMAGFKVGDLLRMKVSSPEKSVGIEEFLTWKNKDVNPVLWKFTGSEFGEEYIPDNAGEQIIVWGRNDSVLCIERETFSSLKIPLYAEKQKAFPKGNQVMLVLTQAVKTNKR